MVLDFGYGFGHGQVFILGGVFFQSPSRLFFFRLVEPFVGSSQCSTPVGSAGLVYGHAPLLAVNLFSVFFVFPFCGACPSCFCSGEDLPPWLFAFLSSRSNLFCMRPVQSFVGLLVLRARMPFRAIAFFFRCVFLRWYARFAI